MALQDRKRDRVPSPTGSEAVASAIICILLVVIVWIAFGRTLGYGFVNLDDQDYVYANPHITRGLSFAGIQWAFTHVHALNWHPLTTISHMLDCQLYGLQAWGHHFTNVLLHSLAAVFLFLALRKLTGSLWSSAVVAAIFAIHPLRVESVAWISERKDLLSGVLFMVTLWAYGGYVQSNRFSLGRYVIVLTLFALGLMCKPTVVTLPFVLLLLDYWPLQRLAISSSGSPPHRGKNRPPRRRSKAEWSRRKSIGYLLLEKVPFFLLSAASCVATVLAQQSTIFTLHYLSFGDRLANIGVSYVIYIGQMICPVRLAALYPYPQGGINIIQTALAFLFLATVSVLFFSWRGKYPFLLTGWLWFIGMLVPMIGLIQVGMQTHADRYTYLPQIGLYLVVTWSAMLLLGNWRGLDKFLGVIAVLIVTGFTAASYMQASTWQDSETLWRRTLANTKDNYAAHSHLAEVLLSSERLDEAMDHLQQTLKISDSPNSYYHLPYPQAHSNLGIVLAKLGRKEEALKEFSEAIRLSPNYRDAHNNMAVLLLKLGRRDEAIVHFREALRLRPDDDVLREHLRNLETGH
ncbi:MAG TPA: tetratricopeptide repeat protein [Terriglobales bacterium]